jgi:hypothetical protein
MLETIFSLFGQISSMNLAVLLVLLVVGIVIAMKVFGYLLRAVLTGIAFGLFPVVASYLGLPVAVSINSIVSSAIFGIILYMAFSAIKMAYGVIKIAFWPFKKLLGMGKNKPQQVIIREVEKKD